MAHKPVDAESLRQRQPERKGDKMRSGKPGRCCSLLMTEKPPCYRIEVTPEGAFLIPCTPEECAIQIEMTIDASFEMPLPNKIIRSLKDE